MNEASVPAQRQGLSLWLVLAAAALTFTLLSYVDEWISLPLRESSSIIAGLLLDLIGYPITRSGTILATTNFSFDVVPACSGSTSLKVLIALGITWCGSHPGLSPLRRLVAIAATIPLAVAINGLRVAALVAIGDSLLHPLEGLAHEAIGILTFLLAMACLFLLGEALAQRRTGSTSYETGGGIRRLIALILVGILAAPALLWCGTAWWASPLDRFGWVFAAIGGAAVWWRWQGVAGDGQGRFGGMLIILALLLVLTGVLVEVFMLQALGMLAVLLAIALWTGGWARVLAVLPFLAAAAVGLPVVGFALTSRTGLDGPLMSVLLRGLLFAGLLGVGWLLMRREEKTEKPKPRPIPVALIAIMAAALAGESALVTSRDVPQPLQIDISWLQGEWVGEPTATDPSAIALLGREHVDTRSYRNSTGGRIDLIITTTGGDRHRAHPPEYCLTGAGWQIDDQRVQDVALAGVNTPVSRLSLHRQDDQRVMVYWFTDGTENTGTYSSMLTADTRRRLAGHRSDWALLRVIGSAKEVDAFLSAFRPVLTAKEIVPAQ